MFRLLVNIYSKMVTPMSNKEWLALKIASRGPVFRCCDGCFASPCTAQCPRKYSLAQKIKEGSISKSIIYNIPSQSPLKSEVGHSKHIRKAIPKKIRGEAWIRHFGDSTKGSCYCCKIAFGIFDNWHAGHIIARSNGGKDTSDNLRPICGSCNQSMGTENMDAFKSRYYP